MGKVYSRNCTLKVFVSFQILLVSNNRLTCLPDELSKMSQLTELDASCNQLTHLPPRMGELRSLQSLVLRNNLLLCVPVEVTYLNLTRFDLRGNRIGTLPVEMRNMTSLITLMVEDNPLTSPPASVSLCISRQFVVSIIIIKIISINYLTHFDVQIFNQFYILFIHFYFKILIFLYSAVSKRTGSYF